MSLSDEMILLQNYKKKKSIDLLSLLLLLLLNAFSNLHPVCSFRNSDLLIPFVIGFKCLYLDRR